MRKTRRLRKGRCIAVLAPLLLAVLLLVGGFLQARAADEGRSMQAVVVGQGDTLWQLVQKHYDYKGDIRRAIYEVRQINGMQDALIVPGQVVYIPRH
jgi:nucleoid-associated protein YgaU